MIMRLQQHLPTTCTIHKVVRKCYLPTPSVIARAGIVGDWEKPGACFDCFLDVHTRTEGQCFVWYITQSLNHAPFKKSYKEGEVIYFTIYFTDNKAPQINLRARGVVYIQFKTLEFECWKRGLNTMCPLIPVDGLKWEKTIANFKVIPAFNLTKLQRTFILIRMLQTLIWPIIGL